MEENEKTPCVLDCFWDKELQACGSCFRTKEEIRDAGVRFKQRQQELKIKEENGQS